MAYETVNLDIEDGVATLTLNRPDAMNAMNQQLIAELRDVVAGLAANDDARVLVITGAGRAFCSGADLAAGLTPPEGGTIGDGIAKSMEDSFNPLALEIASLEMPVISAVNGAAAGGGVGLALAADIVIAGKSGYFVQVFGPKLGLVPDVGCTYYVPRLIGRARARAMALLGDRIYGEQAAEWGLIWKCVEDDALMAEAHEIASRLAKGPTLAFAHIKQVLDQSENNDLAQQLDAETKAQNILGDTEDLIIGVTAFFGKTEPEFKGK